MSTMNDAFGTNALNFTSETKVKNIFINMFATSFSRRYACKHLKIWAWLSIFPISCEGFWSFWVCWWFLTVLRFIIETWKSFRLFVILFNIASTNWTLGRDKLLEFRDALGIERSSLIAEFTYNALMIR